MQNLKSSLGSSATYQAEGFPPAAVKVIASLLEPLHEAGLPTVADVAALDREFSPAVENV